MARPKVKPISEISPEQLEEIRNTIESMIGFADEVREGRPTDYLEKYKDHALDKVMDAFCPEFWDYYNDGIE